MNDYLSGERPVKYVTQQQFEDMDPHALELIMNRYNVQVFKEEKETQRPYKEYQDLRTGEYVREYKEE